MKIKKDVISFVEDGRYIDKYNQVWLGKYVAEEKRIWRQDVGYGLWSFGRGLELIV